MVREADPAHAGGAIDMGGYTDLPPEQRPGYKAMPSGVPMQAAYTPYPQWGYGAPVATSTYSRGAAGPEAGIKMRQDGPINYAKSGLKYSAKPVAIPTPPPLPLPAPQFPGYSATAGVTGLPPPPPLPIPVPGGSNQNIPPPPLPISVPGGPHQTMPPPPLSIPVPGGLHHNMPPPPPPPLSAAPLVGQSQIPPGAIIKEMAPGGLKTTSPPYLWPRGAGLSGEPNLRAPTPNGLGRRMDRLSVSGDRPGTPAFMSGAIPPGSPMLEAYRGTWQQMSPMASPLVMSKRYDDDDLSEMESLDRKGSRSIFLRRSSSPKKRKKSVRIFNVQAEEDARAIAAELSSKKPNLDVLIDILPKLSHDQILELRTEYKRVAKFQGKGINIAKHIKMMLYGNFGKIAYVTALGRWESEGYWANFWYQSNSARRELLIEALMGRTNAEIRKIKDAFRDKRYNDDLVRCMDKELKVDKFRTAVLMALEEQRQDDNDEWPVEYVRKDVDILHRALREGRETMMLEIVVLRSDDHLREVLRHYEKKYGKNFAKQALRRSGNLVGEIIAHILNGVINRPARDAMLLHHALEDISPSTTSSDPRSSKSSIAAPDKRDRYELLISRLVRVHWDAGHFMRVKLEYREKYGRYLEEDLEEAIRSEDFREFCLVMCESAR